MKLSLFEKIDATLDILAQNREDYQQIRQEIKYILLDAFQYDNDMIVDITSRVKTADSLKEKIIRNRLYLTYETPQDIIDHLSDLIGLKIDVRFIDEEKKMYDCLKDKFKLIDDNGHYFNAKYPNIRLELDVEQPQKQRNGFNIYRIDGYYIRLHDTVRFELQIKSMVNSFWGAIEHKLVYKNTNYYVYDQFMIDLLNSINASLALIDQQMRIIYDEMENSNHHQLSLVSEDSFERLIAKAINDLFTEKLKMSIGFTIDLKNTSDILGHYIFLKNVREELNSNDHKTSVFSILKMLNSIDIDFSDEIVMEEPYQTTDPFNKIIGEYLMNKMNEDYEFYVFFQMLFALEEGNNIEDFTLFIEVYKDYLIEDYWFKTSFMKFDMNEAGLIQKECLKGLAKALVHVGTIEIFYNEKLKDIRQSFTLFVEELENRVISYRDYQLYKEAYDHELENMIASIFE